MKNTPQQHIPLSKNSFDLVKYTPRIERFSKNNDIEIVLDETFSHTAAIDLENIQKPKIILNPKMIKEKFAYSDEEIVLDIGHEFGHFKEELQLQSTAKGKDISTQRIKRFEEKQHLAPSYHTLENILRDIWVNNDLISPNNLPVLKDTLYSNYKEKMFKEKNYQELPKHVQFMYTIIRESMVPDEKCIVDTQVRKAIQRLERNETIKESTQGAL